MNSSQLFKTFRSSMLKKRERETEMDTSIHERNIRPKLDTDLFEFNGVPNGSTAPVQVTVSATPQKGSRIPQITSRTGTTVKATGLNSSMITHRTGNTTPKANLNNSVLNSSRVALAKPTTNSRLNASISKPAPKPVVKPAPKTTTATRTTTRTGTVAKKVDPKGLLEDEKKKSGQLQDEVSRLEEQNTDLLTSKQDLEDQLAQFRALQRELEIEKRERTEQQKKFYDIEGIKRGLEYELDHLRNMQKSFQEQNIQNTLLIKQLEHQIGTLESQHRLELSTLKAQQDMAVRLIKQEQDIKLQETEDINARELAQQRETSQREYNKIRGELERTKIDLEYAINENNTHLKTISEHTKTIMEHEDTIKSLESKRNMDEESRRKLHNMIQELKGNIRVYCRVRPLGSNPADNVKEESDEPEFKAINYLENDPENRSIEVFAAPTVNATSTGTNESKKHLFQYDRVFRPDAKQKDIFVEISQLVQSALDGYKVCIFAYGQTGSGKTYTMEGPPKNRIKSMSLEEEEESRGMIPRSVEQIFETMRVMKEQGWKYTLEASFLEIYNESVRDLLSKNISTNPDVEAIKHEIKHDNSGNTSVTNLTTVVVDRPERVHDLLAIASKNRAAAATTCNERSSRSHAVFTLRITGVNEGIDQTTSGVLNLVDLAGSERLSQSKATGVRLDETKNINTSLSCLGTVIAALASKSKHIPYRNSKLTYLLQNCLGGDAKTLMFVNISPKSANVNETICSLRFASKVNSCEIGTASRKVK
jgi:kinesin family protein C1